MREPGTPVVVATSFNKIVGIVPDTGNTEANTGSRILRVLCEAESAMLEKMGESSSDGSQSTGVGIITILHEQSCVE
jgi:hypothetical protein